MKMKIIKDAQAIPPSWEFQVSMSFQESCENEDKMQSVDHVLKQSSASPPGVNLVDGLPPFLDKSSEKQQWMNADEFQPGARG